ncbi:MAG: mechanosensitive ion channel domain-containing protein [Planctomycetota bacterium]
MARALFRVLMVCFWILIGAPIGLAQTSPMDMGVPEVAPATPMQSEPSLGIIEPKLFFRSLEQDAQAWENGDQRIPAMLLRYLPESERSALDDAGVRLALRVARAIRELGPDLDPLRGDLPGDLEYRRFRTHPQTLEPIVIRLVKDQTGAWRLGEQTVRTLLEVDQQLYPQLSARIFRSLGMDPLVDNGVLGMRYDQWISLLAILIVAVMLDLIVRSLVIFIARRFIKRDEDNRTASDTGSLLRRAGKPFGLMAGGWFTYLAIPVVGVPAVAEGVLLVAAKVFALFALLWASFRVVDLVGEFLERRAAATSTRVDDVLVPLIRKALKVFMLAFGLIFIAESLSLPIASLVAGFGIAGAAVAFASKDTIENLFGSIAVILDRPFHVGDWVQINDVEGIVEELGFRSTRIRTFYNSLVTVPNATLVRTTVDNYGMRRFRRFKQTLNVTYDTPPDTIEAFCEGIRELIRQHPHTRKDFFEVHMNQFGAHSLDILLYMFFQVPDWSVELRERHRFILDIVRLAKHLGVEFAFPTQTIHMARDDEAGGSVGPRKAGEAAREDGRAGADAILEGAEFRRTS